MLGMWVFGKEKKHKLLGVTLLDYGSHGWTRTLEFKKQFQPKHVFLDKVVFFASHIR